MRKATREKATKVLACIIVLAMIIGLFEGFIFRS
ncbi:putative membrane protein SpoIIM required for sporulation [Clostridium acetobutylicum]|nr:putative membrane protein SpoIIM required for sporulation [Clostridium acetobutylicum]NOW14898.1 putative membrane protein SpoIIM required for sporulation [Clostridium acetobutylicum]NRY56579.1 putative membrane protein SpoIIM required for sporulation [Clostridium acetobutylicum]NSA93324.1 putative membrane protein SpoIIM required for sporulation [Clostridium acetobutylicum]NYC94406.1 putative membrane protein SpoIIM required for sporulation [Clostridium acetobutylicum]